MKLKTFWILLSVAVVLAFFGAKPAQTMCIDCTFAPSLPGVSTWLSSPSTMKLPYPPPPSPEEWRLLKPDERLKHTRERVLEPLTQELMERDLQLGASTFLRVFKESRELELWLESQRGWKLFRKYPIAAMSGALGPKLKEGDGQAPEGFYGVTKSRLNPGSSFHLSFNIGYPNAYDVMQGRTGSFIMVHGGEVSIGCFAMTDPLIEEIYLIVQAALTNGQDEVPVHVFPFPVTEERLAAESKNAANAFWQELRPGYEAFERNHTPPTIEVQKGCYVLQP
ncbi:L,D-transpeptidase family protein [Prosthecobacter dejongeii]|uniref:Murein L,D-transpeptidase YafK n=1 Tax=Prosthecobacter dejongeii TaxID=48465 RepID=A0A7W8DQQ3_9BACT|nr:L,D-transpeptidase family protein [Prosthecobacter dejongeii]MBB5039049.1 murein L,D-transpeptidase YafK [Prosthecobacter dejongeii]